MNKDLFQQLCDSIEEAGAVNRKEREPAGRWRTSDECPRAVRIKLGLSQAEFAQLLGISIGTLRNWEQGRRQPHGAARILIRIAAKNPKAVLEAVA